MAAYLVQMSETGYGINREEVMGMAYTIVEKSKRSHPFREGSAGRAWFEGFMRHHPKLTVRSPQPLSYCRALCSNKDTIMDFFVKLGTIYGRLNLISKPMQIYNCDESGVTVVFKPNKVVAELGKRNVYAISAAERGKTHTVLSCVSASGFMLPPMMVYPRKTCVPDKFKEGAIPNTLFGNSESGWINSKLFLEWFAFFIKNIPPVRPVLLVQDGHSSHISIELVEMARANDVTLLCLPAHTSHILQPLDVGVFKSFKASFNKTCGNYVRQHPGRVITTDVLASMVAQAYPTSFTPVNVLSGFKKAGVYPFNPSEVNDRQLVPSTVFQTEKSIHTGTEDEASCSSSSEKAGETPPGSSLFSPEKEALFARRYEEHYDISDDVEYNAWLKINHPEVCLSACKCSDTSSEKVSEPASTGSPSPSKDYLSEVFVLPEPKKKSGKKRRV